MTGASSRIVRYPSAPNLSAYRPRRVRRLDIVPRRPAADAADREQNRERDEKQHDRDGRRAGDVVALVLAEDVHGRDLRPVREVAGDEHDRPELADRTRERERDSREDRG